MTSEQRIAELEATNELLRRTLIELDAALLESECNLHMALESNERLRGANARLRAERTVLDHRIQQQNPTDPIRWN